MNKKEEGLTLLELIRRLLPEDLSNKEIKRAIESNSCRINGVVERVASQKVAFGDLIEWERICSLKPSSFDPARIVYEDKDLIVYNKPPGVCCDHKLSSFFLVHRLDKYTSGALLLAKNSNTEKVLLEAFKNRKVEKCYFALCDGVLKEKKFMVENQLGKVGSYQGQTLYGSVASGKTAKTLFSVQQTYIKASLVACYPETGRTHQIRVHLNELGHPILGDFQYGKKFYCPLKPPRLMLHAYRLKIKDLVVTVPIPKDFQDVIELLASKSNCSIS